MKHQQKTSLPQYRPTVRNPVSGQAPRLSRFLADCGVSSRRKCGDLIKEGRVSVNNSITKDLSLRVGEHDTVKLDGNEIKPDEKLVMALNKPVGFLSTAKDDFNRKTVIHLTGVTGKRLYPAGRLDQDSRGLMILTNDGDLAYRITHPRYNIPKTYEVCLDKPLSGKDYKTIETGVLIDKKLFRPDKIVLNTKSTNGFPIIIKIHEGRKRIIRRAFKKIGYNVKDLKRIMIGDYRLKNISEGKYKILNEKEIKKLLVKDNLLQ
jgi:23S rRNA pseudouridine2605 synthase